VNVEWSALDCMVVQSIPITVFSIML